MGDVVVEAGDVLTAAGVGFLAGCGVLEVPVYRRPRVAIIATGSELVPPSEVPGPGKIRNSNSYAMAACAREAGAEAVMLPIVQDTFEALRDAVEQAAREYDFVVTTGGAANGDFDFIKPVVAELGELMMTTVNIRPGKAQTFGMVEGTPVFGLPGNPAAAYGLPAAHPPRAAHHAGLSLHGPSRGEGAPYRRREETVIRAAYLREPDAPRAMR